MVANTTFCVNLYPNEYNLRMYFIEKTTEFDKWFKKLNDLRAKAKILFRLQKLEKDEHFGDCEPVGDRDALPTLLHRFQCGITDSRRFHPQS